MAPHAFIIGGTGQIGRAIALELVSNGWEVTVGHRGSLAAPSELVDAGVRIAALDRNESGALAGALSGTGVDALIDTVAYDRHHADQLLELQGEVGAYVVISSASVYRDADGRALDGMGGPAPRFDGPISEDHPTVKPGPENYATGKVALEARLLEASQRPVVVLRAGAIHGEGCRQPREWWFIKRMLDGRSRIPMAYGGSSRLHTSATRNIAALTRAALQARKTLILNAADPDAPSVREIGMGIARHLGYGGELIPLDDAPDGIGATPWSVPTEVILDTSASLRLGYEPATTYAQALPDICDQLVNAAQERDWKQVFPGLARYPFDLFDYAAEDEFLERSKA